MAKKEEVFISYSTKDTDTAFALLETLESYGLDCWIAPRNIPQGAQWAEEIDKAIQNARVFVVIVSSHSVESKQVPKEIALAVSACESIFPFRIDDISLQGTFRYYLSDYQFTDATTDTKQKMAELAKVICSSLGKTVPNERSEEEEGWHKTSSGKTNQDKISSKKTNQDNTPAKTSNQHGESEITQNQQAIPGTKPRKPLLLGIIAAAAVIAAILGIVLSGKGKKEDPSANSVTSAVEESSAAENTTEEGAVAESAPAADHAAETTPEDSAEPTAQGTSAQKSEVSPFGVWKKIAYEDRGAATDIHTDDLYILDDGTPYFSLEDGLAGISESALLPEQLLKDSSKYDLVAEPAFEDHFDGSISDKTSGLSTIAVVPYESIFGTGLAEENPTGLAYEDCYPEQYYYVHLTGSYQESPVKKSDVDTWIVYEKQYPVISECLFPALAGTWKDEIGNRWEFSVNDGNLSFKMTDTDGGTHEGVKYSHLNADKEKENFFEHIRFEFDDYKTDYYAVLAFDGQKLEMLDQDWNTYTLTKTES